MKIAVVGGGCSGLIIANRLNEEHDVFLLEKSNKLGKKILASGNGKCNFTNISDLNNKYNCKFANEIINKFNVDKTLEFFKSKGLIYKNDDQGRCYPVSECSYSVLDCLKSELKNVKVYLDCCVKSIKPANESKYIVEYGDKKEIFDVVVCSSGSSASNLGSDKAYSYLSNLNLDFVKTKASLAPVCVAQKIEKLKGVRVKCKMSLENGKQTIYEEVGEIMFKEDALSGIAVFNACSYINRCEGNYKIKLDLSNGISDKELFNYFKNKSKDYFVGFLNDKLAEYICDKLNLSEGELDAETIKKIIKIVKGLSFDVTKSYPLTEAQVCSGGISINEVTNDLELKKYPNVFVAGELLDVDGVSGGYNMQFAWSSAAVIAKKINEIK